MQGYPMLRSLTISKIVFINSASCKAQIDTNSSLIAHESPQFSLELLRCISVEKSCSEMKLYLVVAVATYPNLG